VKNREYAAGRYRRGRADPAYYRSVGSASLRASWHVAIVLRDTASVTASALSVDSAAARKARGAFFTPPALCRHVVEWAVRTPNDAVLEPSCGEAAFLLAAGERLDALAGSVDATRGRLDGIELHEGSARHAETLVRAAGHDVAVQVSDFFTLAPTPVYDAVIGNPPYVRYQDFSGVARARGRAAALGAGVTLTGLASSWAAFTVHAAMFLRPGGRLGLVLPAELLTVNYAAEVRHFLVQRFARVRLVLFTKRVFPGVLEEVVLLLADGYGEGPAGDCELHQVEGVDDLVDLTGEAQRWTPTAPYGKWMPSLLSVPALTAYAALEHGGGFTPLHTWGRDDPRHGDREQPLLHLVAGTRSRAGAPACRAAGDFSARLPSPARPGLYQGCTSGDGCRRGGHVAVSSTRETIGCRAARPVALLAC
jgi:N-6 DNA Methylase